MNAEKFNVILLKDGPVNETIFVLGQTGSGKTTLMASLLLQKPRFVIFDTRNEYDCAYFGKDCLAVERMEDFVNALNDAKMKIVFKVPAHVASADDCIDEALGHLYSFQYANKESGLPPVAVSMDELNRFVSTHDTPFALREIISRGRDLGFTKIFGAQWFGTIPPWVRDSFSEIYAFRHNDKNGLILLERFGFEPEQLKTLPAYHCLHAGKNGVELLHLTPVAGAKQSTQHNKETASVN